MPLVVNDIERNELNRNAMGGTELMQLGLTSRLPKELLDGFQIIASRVRDLDPNRKRLFWCHDLAEDPEVRFLSEPKGRAKFEKLVFVSDWQFTCYNKVLGVQYSDSVVLKNAIEPIEVHTKSTDGPIRLIYHTTPHRGLDVLLTAYEVLSKKWGDRVHLDVYSSFRIYGWQSRDADYEKLFDFCRGHPHITYHGSVPNSEIREALKSSHIFAYPSTWQETSCIAAMEAMSAGCAVVHSSLGALPETLANFGVMYPYHEDKTTHANTFLNVLDNAIQHIHNEHIVNFLQFQKTYADTFYSWERRAHEWKLFLESLST